MVILPLFLLAFAPADPALLSLDEWVHDWETSRDFTLGVAQKMPADLYTFRATPEEMPFGVMTLHIANAILYRFEQVSGVKPDVNTKVTGKDEILRVTKEAFDYAIRVLPKISAEQLAQSYVVSWEGRRKAIGRQIVLAMFVHTAHHRAQLEVYLRLKGIAPPTYTF